jgi:hypothetical protein
MVARRSTRRLAENPTTRARAVSALNRCGDVSVPAKMLPLAKAECGSDPRDDIKGQALDILWPNYISATELFALLTHPNEGYYGAYANFLSALPETLTDADLLPALTCPARQFESAAERLTMIRRDAGEG